MERRAAQAVDYMLSRISSACLIACLKKENKSQSVVKLVATNLIASGDTQLGVQLLCVIHKALDACRYLQSNGQWDKSIWLAKVSRFRLGACPARALSTESQTRQISLGCNRGSAHHDENTTLLTFAVLSGRGRSV